MSRLSSNLLEKAEQVFSSKESIDTNEGLSRGELRILERRNIVEKFPYYDVRKKKLVGWKPPMRYKWRVNRQQLSLLLEVRRSNEKKKF